MVFNSGVFFAFFLIVYGLYWLLRKHLHWQNTLLLAASYVFYGWWDWRFLSLIMVSTLVDFLVGRRLGSILPDSSENQHRRKRLLFISIAFNLGLLGFFKYFNFFASSLVDATTLIGWHLDAPTLNIILPVGISFYTFQTMSYTIDVYREKLTPTNSLLNFATFVALFPQLVAGPIERATNLLPQIENARRVTPEQIHTGLYLILWGLFKKVAVADQVSVIANEIFDNYSLYNGPVLLVGILAFAVQIYGDFSGYSDIARGVARLMGFELMVNFRLPYFALSPSDFWNRWHISLSTWLRDYLYIPLGGNRRGSTYRNLFLTMLLGGLWHGAAWNFIFWGAYHGLILMIYRRFDQTAMHQQPWSGVYPRPLVMSRLLLMFGLTLFGWLLFRAQSLDQIIYMSTHIISASTGAGTRSLFQSLLFYSAPLVIVDTLQYLSRDLLILTKWPLLLQILTYIFLFLWLMLYGAHASTEFIYFQF